MKRYNIFNGEIFPHLIGKKLREIASQLISTTDPRLIQFLNLKHVR